MTTRGRLPRTPYAEIPLPARNLLDGVLKPGGSELFWDAYNKKLDSTPAKLWKDDPNRVIVYLMTLNEPMTAT